MKPSVFVGSSREQISIADAIEVNLASTAEISSWKHSFSPGQSIYTELLKLIHRVDFAILVLTPDDVIISREQSEFAPRDNVVFELGLFLGSIGDERVFAVVDEHTKTKLMSDYRGVTILTYDSKRSDGNFVKALSPACIEINNHMLRLSHRKREVDTITTRTVKSLINTPLNDYEVHVGLDYLYNKALTFDPDFIAGINRGGAILGGMIAKRLGMMIQILEVTHRHPVYFNVAEDLLDGKKVLLIDDRLRVGKNIKKARDYLHQRRANVYSMVFTLPEGWANQGLPQEFAYKVSVPDLPFPWEPGGAKEWK